MKYCALTLPLKAYSFSLFFLPSNTDRSHITTFAFLFHSFTFLLKCSHIHPYNLPTSQYSSILPSTKRLFSTPSSFHLIMHKHSIFYVIIFIHSPTPSKHLLCSTFHLFSHFSNRHLKDQTYTLRHTHPDIHTQTHTSRYTHSDTHI